METKVLKPGEGRVLNVIGDNQIVRLSGEETGGKFVLVEQNNGPGVGVPPHTHDNEDELFQIVEGEMTFTVAGETVIAPAGTTVFLPRGVPHSFMTSGEGNTKSLIMAFPAGIENMFDELSAFPPGPPDMEKVLAICERYGVRFV